jgi:predicted nucleic acid-binding protein
LIVFDASFVYALLATDDAHHSEAATWYEKTNERLTTTPLVLAEIDHLVRRSGGHHPTSAFRRDLASDAYDVHWWPRAAAEAVGVAEQYADLGLSLTDASLVALAAHISTDSVATFDERHFRVIRPLSGAAAFTLLPRDAALA